MKKSKKQRTMSRKTYERLCKIEDTISLILQFIGITIITLGGIAMIWAILSTIIIMFG